MHNFLLTASLVFFIILLFIVALVFFYEREQPIAEPEHQLHDIKEWDVKDLYDKG